MRKLINILIFVILLLGIGLMLYPFVSNQITQIWNNRAMEKNGETLRAMEALEKKRILAAAQRYNMSLQGGISDAFSSNKEADDAYMDVLNPAGDGIMGSIDIPKAGIHLPIFHTTRSDVLRMGVGHVENTSLPIGGLGTHCALAGHNGLPSARLFTDLVKVEVGDTFTLHILDDDLLYQVDQILVVEPSETQYLLPESDKDLVTLVTCTPYGINSHRLLVRGTRVMQSASPLGDAPMKKDNTWLYIAIGGVCILLLGTIAVLLQRLNKNHN